MNRSIVTAMSGRVLPIVLAAMVAGVGCTVVQQPPSTPPPSQSPPSPASTPTPQQSPPPASTPTKPVPPTATATLGYTPKLVPMKGQRGSATFDVQLPQLDGGNAAARNRFNQGMQTALDDLINQFSDQRGGAQIVAGRLWPGDESSRVTGVTEHLVAGMAVFNWDSHGAHPNQELATVVINTATARPITFADVFPNQEVARARLSELVPQLDQTGRLRGQPVQYEKFLNWLPTPDGLRVYVRVAHVIGDFAPVTVPWDKIRDLVAPGELPILTQ